ncbi:MAG: ATP-binding protein [Promethearchaeota archaeon]
MSSETDPYRKLQQRLDQLPIGYPATESGVEIRILKHLFTPKEAEIAIELSLAPEPVKIILRRFKSSTMTSAELKEHLDNMVKKGAINHHSKRDGNIFYSIAFLAVGMFEYQVSHLTKEFYADFKQYLDEAFRDEFLSTRIPQLRTIPTEGSIPPDIPIASYDHIRHLIDDFSGPIGVTNCVCKQGADLLGHSCQVTDKREICMLFGGAARQYTADGWGRTITKDECFSILAQAEKDGLVVQPSNSLKLSFLCLCCGCCCDILSNAKPLDNPVQYFATNYRAVVDFETCVGCGTCVERCQMDAIEIEDGKSIIDLTRCIGCGLCVTTCPEEAMTLEKKPETFVPPANSLKLYMKIMKKRIGNAKYSIMLTKQLLGRFLGKSPKI